MKPLNQPERRTRLWQFLLLYLVALLVPLGASYYLFSNRSIADENTRLKRELDRTHAEQTRLVMQFDTLTNHLQRVNGLDLRIRREPDQQVRSELTVRSQDQMSAIAFGLSELRRDSAQMQVPAHRLLARDVLRNFDLVRSTRNTVEVLQLAVDKGGDAAKTIESLNNQLNQVKQQVVTLQAAAGNRPAPQPQPQPSGDGSPKPNSSTRVQLAFLQNRIDYEQADCLRQQGMQKKGKDRKLLLEQSRTAFLHILQDPATDDMKSTVEKVVASINVELGHPRLFGLF